MKKILLLLTVLIFALQVSAQEFVYQNKLKNDKLSEKQKNELQNLAITNCLYNGELQFQVQENDVRPLSEDYSVKAYTILELIDYHKEKLVNASSLDSISIYLALKSAYINILQWEEAGASRDKVYTMLDRLMKEEGQDSSKQADIIRMAGSYMLEYGKEPADAFPYFTQAIMLDPSDTASYIFVMLIYTKYGAFDEADSVANVLRATFPSAISPYILQTNTLASRMFVENMDEDSVFLTRCLDDLVDISYLSFLKNSKKNTSENLLYYLLMENVLLLKYYSLIGEDTDTEILDCDMDYIKAIRNECKNHDYSVSKIPEYTSLNALAWTYSIEHKFDSSLYYLSKAYDAARTLDVGYSDVVHNIMNSMMAFTFLNGDTVAALKILEKKIDLKDSIGIRLTDYVLMGRLFIMIGDNENAHKYAALALEYNPSFAAAFRVHAYADFKKGETEKAFEYMKSATEVDNKNFETYLLTGLMYMLDGNSDIAYTYFEAAYYLDPSSVVLDDLMNELYLKNE